MVLELELELKSIGVPRGSQSCSDNGLPLPPRRPVRRRHAEERAHGLAGPAEVVVQALPHLAVLAAALVGRAVGVFACRLHLAQ